MPLKLEQERPRMRLELRLTMRRQHQLIEQLGIEEPGIRLTRPHSITSVLRVAWNGDLFPHFEAHLKVFGNLIQIVTKLIHCRRSIERRIVPYGPEEWLVVVLILAVF